MAWLFGGMVRIYGIFFYWKTVLNQRGVVAGQEACTLTALQLATNIRRSVLKLKGDHMVDDGAKVDYDAMEVSEGFREYTALAHQLVHIDLSQLNEMERRAFFINVYNSLVIHALVYGFVRKSYWGFWISRKLLYSTAAYNIGGLVYSLDEIEHGILRGNSCPVGAAEPLFLIGNPRLPFVVEKDARIHFALNCGAISCPPISAYKADTLHQDLSRASKNYLQSTTFKEEDNKTIIVLSKLLMWYRVDFGSSDKEVLEWVRDHSGSAISDRIKSILEVVDDGQKTCAIEYQDYEWDVNSK